MSAGLRVGSVRAAAVAIIAMALSGAAGALPAERTLRIWGPVSMSGVVARWAAGLREIHPEIRVVAKLMGSDTAIAGLYSGRADIALMGRRDDVTDDNGFSRPKGYMFLRVELLNGSIDTDSQSPALAVLVQRGNPVEHLTLAQLAVAASCGCADHPRSPVTWGTLGVRGPWALKPVHLYVYDIDSGTGSFFLDKVLHGSRKLDWRRVRDFGDARPPGGAPVAASARIAAALRADPDGLAISTMRYAGRELKAIPLGSASRGPFVLPGAATIGARSYPLARRGYGFIDRPPGAPIAPQVAAFLRYVLSTRGQADVARAGGYLPLDRATRSRQLQLLQ